MKATTTYTYEVDFRSPHDPAILVGVLRGAAAGWASCSNESEPLLDLADQIERQGYPKI